jgi:DNA-binding response OmpR family regulator
MRILVVEGDPDLRDVIAMLLERGGYEVAEAGDGREALALWHAQRADLVLIDLVLPRMSGWELCRRVRAEASVPIVIVGFAEQGTDSPGIEALGVADYISKPFDATDLVTRIRRILDRAR